MLKQLTILLTIISCCLQGQAQDYFPLYTADATWKTSECFWFDCWTRTYEYEKDTSFCGEVYSKMRINSSNIAYVRNWEGGTYTRRNTDCTEKEYLMYQYRLNVGDTVYVGNDLRYSSGAEIPFVLESMDSIVYEGFKRLRYTMAFKSCTFCDDKMYWVQGIGSLTHPFYSYKCLAPGCEQQFKLLCSEIFDIRTYEAMNYDCDQISGIEETWADNIAVFPNPFHQNISIDIDANLVENVDLFSISGRRLDNYKITKTNGLSITFEQSPPLGVYLLKIKTTKGVLTKRMVRY